MSQPQRSGMTRWLPFILAANATVWTVNAVNGGGALEWLAAGTGVAAFVLSMVGRVGRTR